MSSYYNDSEPFVVQWLKNLSENNLIPKGITDGRSIQEVQASDLKGFVQCHFFGGIAGWPFALQLVDWPEDRPVWTGSCPCQPFSVAGLGKGDKDERHLWPEFLRLIAECRPPTIFGEQVAGKDGRTWLAGVRADLEALGYAVGAADLCAASTGAPHIRQRLFWVAHSVGAGLERGAERTLRDECAAPQRGGRDSGLADAQCDTRKPGRFAGQPTEGDGAPGAGTRAEPGRCGVLGGLGNATLDRREQRRTQSDWWSASSANLSCLDGRSRRIPLEPRFQPLAHGVPARVGRLRAYGNAIVPQVAAEFIKAYLDTGTEDDK